MAKENLPQHLAIIMDGNGRWAKDQGKSRTYGHEIGAQTLLDTVKIVQKKGIKVLSVYAFSTENFKRPLAEVNFIMDLFVKSINKFMEELVRDNIKIIFSGRRDSFSDKVIKSIESITNASKENTGLILNICFNYGSQGELVDAVKSIINNNTPVDQITESVIENYLYQNLPAIDLLIRTSGEKRLSNFMLWQLAYAELYFTDLYWPEFNELELDKALASFATRNRRYGGLS